MAIKELSSSIRSAEIGILPGTDETASKSALATDQPALDNPQFFNRELLEANRRDLGANWQARKLNNALDGSKPQQVLVSADVARYINKGLDGKDRQVKFTTEELIAFSKMADPREAIWRAALERFGNLPSDKTAVDDYLTEYKNARDGEATISWRSGDEKGNNIGAAELKVAIQNQIKAEQYKAAYEIAIKNNRRPPAEPKYAIVGDDTKADFFSLMVVDAPTRQAIFSKWLDKNGSPEMKLKFERDKLESNINLRVEEAQKRLKKEFDALKNDNNLYNSFVDLKYQNALKDEIDKIIEQTQADFRGQGLGSQIGDASEAVLRGIIDNHPLYRFLPDSVKDEIVKFGVGVEKGVIGIAAGVKGANDFVNDAIEDAVVYGLKSSGIDTSSYEKHVTGERAERREFWTQLSSISTKQMSQADRAYAEKIERGLYVTPYDLPNKSTTLGQVAPQVALGIATGGESLGAQILISAATQATLAGGETYITSNNRSEAVKAATIAGVQGAIAPVTAKLPLPADLAANALMTYTTGKLQGLDDNKIFESIVTQTALSGGFRAGNKLHDWLAVKEGKTSLSIDEAKAAMQKHQAEFLQVFDAETKTSFTKNAKEIYVKAQATVREARANYGKENKLFTKAGYERAGVEIERYARRSLNQVNIGVDPSILPKIAERAGYHVEALTRAGRQTFGEFASAMRAEAAAAKIKLSDADVQKLYKEATNEYLTKAREPLSKPARSEFDAMRAKANGDEAFLANLPKGAENIQKKFEGIAVNKAKQANAPQLAIEQQAKLDAARAQLDKPEFIGRKSVQKAIADDRPDDIAGYVGVELAKQKLAVEYPASKGYQIQESVLLYKDSGFKTIAEWEATHPGKPSKGVVEMDGKAWQKVTDADLMVVKKNATGKYEIVQVEQIKAGKQPASQAREQLDITTDALRKISNGDASVRIVDKRANQAINITDNYDLKNFDQAKAITRGADDKQNYDATIGLTRNQIRQLAEEMIAKHQTKGGN